MTLRETIESAVNTVEQGEVKPETPAITETPKTETVEAPVKTEEAKGRTAGRPRDEHGRLLPGKPEKPAAELSAPVASPAPALEPAKPKAAPSSWKKEHWPSWEKLSADNPQLADYLLQREGEFAKGVSTYKQEYDSVKPLVDAIQPFLPQMQQANLAPAEWISAMGHAHHALLYGTPQQKLQMFTKMAQDYRVPLQALYDPNAQQQYLMQQTLQPPPAAPDVRALVQEQMTDLFARQDLQQFQAAKDASGNPLYPHYETVRNTMAQLLDAGAAEDLKSAYDKAIRLHDDIWSAEQQAKQAAAHKAAQEAQAKQVAQAKAAAVSTRTATPAGEAAKTTKGVRAAVESAVEAHAEGGRV